MAFIHSQNLTDDHYYYMSRTAPLTQSCKKPWWKRPLFDYGDIIWDDKNNATLMNDLQIQQNKAAKIIVDKAKCSSARDKCSWDWSV